LLPLIGPRSSVPKPARTLETTYTVEPTQDGEKQVTLRRVGDIQAVLAVYHVPAASDPDFAPIDVMMAVLADAPAGRLYKALVDTKKAVQGVGLGQQLNDLGTAIFWRHPEQSRIRCRTPGRSCWTRSTAWRRSRRLKRMSTARGHACSATSISSCGTRSKSD
jgi:hypothetical protein